MREDIRELGEHINQELCQLRRKITDMDNRDNPCACDKAVKFDFSNIMVKGLNHTFCLNCGGFV